MRMSVDDCIKCWMPAMIQSLGRDKARTAADKMRRLIEKAKAAEREGRIVDMQPLMAVPNTSAAIAAGIFNLEIRYHPIVDGKKGDRVSWIAPILKPDEDHDRAPQETTGPTDQS